MSKGRNRTFPLIILSPVFLFNPNVNMIDILPDFVAYLILLRCMGMAPDIIPYLEECKDALRKLTIISIVKIPAMLIMFANMYSGRDIIPLFTLSFSVFEIIFLYSAISNGFKGLFYIGERTAASGLIEPIKIYESKGNKKELSADKIKNFTYLFVTVKSLFNVLPEFCLLTFSNLSLKKFLASIYPIILLISVAIAFIVALIWLIIAIKYVKAIHRCTDIKSELIKLADDEKLKCIESKAKLKKLMNALSLFAISSIFTFDLTFRDLGNINILPHFIFGILILSSILCMTDSKRKRITSIILGGSYTVSAFAGYISQISFFDNYDYIDLYNNKTAQNSYSWIKFLGTVEAISALIMLSFFAVIFVSFIKQTTYISPDDMRYAKVDMDRHKLLTAKSTALFSSLGVINILKCAEIYLRSSIKPVFSDATAEIMPSSPMPWLGTLIFALSVLLVIYTLYFVSELKNDINMKYLK